MHSPSLKTRFRVERPIDLTPSQEFSSGRETKGLLVEQTGAILRKPHRESAAFEGEGSTEIGALVFVFCPILQQYFGAVRSAFRAGDLCGGQLVK